VTWLFWVVCISIISIIFWRLWKYAEKIEREELEEQQWTDYINSLWQTDPAAAYYWTQIFEQKFK
jgi:hypothetical protein